MWRRIGLTVLGITLAIPLALAAKANGQITFTIIDKGLDKPVACRIHLFDAAGKPVQPRKLPAFRDHFVCPGVVELDLPPGKYRYEIERGPEYSQAKGVLTVMADQQESIKVELQRIANLAAEGWWSGELHVHRPLWDIELLMRAEDLHIAPVITWWNKRNPWTQEKPPESLLVRFDGNRYYHVMAGEDEREGGALLYFQLPKPLAIQSAEREHPSPMKFLAEARRQEGVWIDIEKPFWWDVPIWLASGQVDSIGIANNHMNRSGMYPGEAWGRPRDSKRLPPPLGNGYWSQEIYYHILNCGLRIPPSAGSASGVLPNPVGYNRVYVHVDGELTWEKWWAGLRAGRSFVTNGPLLRTTATGKLPGHIFQVEEGKTLELAIRAELSGRDRVRAFEIIKDGRVERSVPREEWSKSRRLGTIQFNRAGWFLVRAIADNPDTLRFASTAPYYVEAAQEKQRISKASAQFFLDWVRERMMRVKVRDPGQYEEVMQHHRAAEKFWEKKVAAANAE